jgi:uncharacterized protein
MNAVFLDTVGLLAVWDVDDQWHQSADDAYRKIVSARQPIVTTTFVLLECGNAAARRAYREDLCLLRRTLEQRNEVVIPTDTDWAKAWTAYEQRQAGAASIVDQVSFAVMHRLGIQRAFTSDRHFQEAGFETLF